MAYTRPHLLPMALPTTLACFVLAACGGGAADAMDAQVAAAATAGQTGTAAPRASTGAAAGHAALGVPADELTQIAQPFGSRHEALPDGVPLSYDWAQVSRLDRGNSVPAGYGAFTGWGQVFWAAGSAGAAQAVEIRSNQSYVCSGPAHQWSRLQQGGIEGAAFRADYVGNEAVPARIEGLPQGQTRVSFAAGRAFHYWPGQGRVNLGSEALCGVLVLFQARAVAADGSPLPSGTPAALLIGAGADYWTTTTAPWDNYRTNQGVGLGQLRRLGAEWRWYGMNTAAAADLQKLLQDGFVDRTTP